jgi:hypothetical protein
MFPIVSLAGYRLAARVRGYRAMARRARRRLRALHPAKQAAASGTVGPEHDSLR